jgi:peptidoglycan-associated lipoprotein
VIDKDQVVEGQDSIKEKGEGRMSSKAVILLVSVAWVVTLFMGCQRKVLVEEQAQQENTVMREDQIMEEEQPNVEREEIEASLQAKRYSGIEGEVFESSMLRDIHFAFDRYDLSLKARKVLAENAGFILKFPEAKIQIEGHCDERGTNEYNLALGVRRASNAKKYLISLGVPPGRLSTISYGEELPADPRHDEGAWAKNRRGHFVVLSR